MLHIFEWLTVLALGNYIDLSKYSEHVYEWIKRGLSIKHCFFSLPVNTFVQVCWIGCCVFAKGWILVKHLKLHLNSL